MKKILLLNYYWPPCGGPAVQRWLDITNYLEADQIQTFVVTVKEDAATFPIRDQSLEERISKSTKVFKTGTSELFGVYKKFIGKGKVPSTGLVDEPNPSAIKKIARFVRGNFFLPDPRIGWNKHAFLKAAELITENNIKIIFTAGPPQSTHLVGLKLKQKFPDLIWIVDLHDYWTDNFNLKLFYRTQIAAFFDRILERKVLHKADLIMTHCKSSQKLYSNKIRTEDKSKIFVHTMGFNEALFLPLKNKVLQKQFIISYVGTIADNYDPESFIIAFKTAINGMSDISVKLKFVGTCSPGIRSLFIKHGIENQVQETGYLPHEAAVEELLGSTALFLINPKSEHEKIIVPGKLYEYLASFKPIICISHPDSEISQIINEFEAGKNFERANIIGIAGYLTQLMEIWKDRKEADLIPNDRINKFSRKKETEILVKTIKRYL